MMNLMVKPFRMSGNLLKSLFRPFRRVGKYFSWMRFVWMAVCWFFGLFRWLKYLNPFRYLTRLDRS